VSQREGTILIIDDDTNIRDAMRDTLEDEGYAVDVASNGADALTYLHSHPAPSLIFLDWNMAPMNATQFMAQFCKESAFAHVPVVLITADMKADTKVKTSRYEGFLRKPISLDTLFAFASRFAAPA